jgi:hypothetical protein
MRRPSSALRLVLALVLVAGALGSVGGGVYAAFYATTGNSGSAFTAKRIFPGDRNLPSWDIRDASGGGAETNNSDVFAYDDVRFQTTTAWANAYSASRYLDFDFSSYLPAGLPLDSLTFTYKVASNGGAGSGNACYFLDARTASTNTVLGTYGSSGSPVACSSGTTYVTTTTTITHVTTSDAANDLRIRVWGWETGAKASRVDVAYATATIFGVEIPIYEVTFVDAADTTPATTNWSLAAVDGTYYQDAANLNAAFQTARYIRFPFPKSIPGSAKDITVTLEHSFATDRNGDTGCWYADILNGATLVETVGSSGSPVGCVTSTAFTTQTASLAAVDTADEVNNLVVKMYLRNSAGRKTRHDMVRVVVSYTLDHSGCVDTGGTTTVSATADSYVRQDQGNNNFGTATTMFTKSQTSNVQRALLTFSLPTAPTDCSATGATLRVYLSATGGARTVTATALSASWTETGVTWNNQPGTTGSSASVTTGSAGSWTTWDVGSIVSGMYSGSNYGFILKDGSEGSGNVTETFHTRENTNKPELVVTWG